MNTKWLIIFICLILVFMLIYGFSYTESYYQLVGAFDRLSSAIDTVSGLFGILSDRTENLTFLFPNALGYIELDNMNVDISTYIKEHYLPNWLDDISNEYIVNIYASPKFYNVRLNTGYSTNTAGILINTGKNILQTNYAIRLKIVIDGNNYKSEHNVFVVLGDYYAVGSSDSRYGVYYVSFDNAIRRFTIGSSYNTFEEFLADSNNVTGIISYDESARYNYPYNSIVFEETDVNLNDGFINFYNFTEGVN